MSHELRPVIDMESLIDRLDIVLGEAGLEKESRPTALIALAFCDLLKESLDENQVEAVDAAHQFWFYGDSNARERWLVVLSGKLDSDQEQASRSLAAINRLVWTALNANTGLSSYTGEFLVGLGEDAGLDFKKMTEVFSEHIPGFNGVST